MSKLWKSIPDGVRRIAIALALVWIVAYWIWDRENIAFGWTAAMSTPSTTCADVYADGEMNRLSCEGASVEGGWVEQMLAAKRRKEKGQSGPFDPYQAQRSGEAWVAWQKWLGVPLAILMSFLLGAWVFAGFRTSASQLKGE